MKTLLKHDFYHDETVHGESLLSNNKISRIQNDCVIEGNISTSNDIEVMGALIGDLKANHVKLNKGATLRGDVNAEQVDIAGKFSGKIDAFSTHIEPIAKIDADIKTNDISVGYGAAININVTKKKN